jgi:radical SAM-linked protein
MRCLERLFRRARLPLGMTEGFHPKPRMAFPLALAVGIESLDEVMELELSEHRTAEELLPPLCAEAPPGLAFASVVAMPEGSRKAQAHHVAYEAVIPPDCRRGLAERIDGLMARGSCPVRRPNRAE